MNFKVPINRWINIALLLAVLLCRHVNGQCPLLEAPNNGSLCFPGEITPPYVLGAVVLYICDTGYGIESGAGTRHCDGITWSGVAATCSKITCPSLPATLNADIVYIKDETAPYDFGTVAFLVCTDGHYTNDDVIRHCGGHGSSVNGNWDGTTVSCLVVECDSLPPPDNGVIVHSDPTAPHAYLSMATYTCNYGFRLAGGDTVQTCVQSVQGSGEWNGTAVSCDVLTCDALSNPPNGRWNYTPSDTPYEVGTVATLTCSTGHLLSGTDTRNCMSDSVGEIGTWNGTDSSSCIAITCDSLSISNGAITYSTTPDSGSYSFSTTASYTCNDGFYLQGSKTRSCGGDGQNDWGSNSPTCLVVDCTQLPSLSNGFVFYTPDTTAPFDFQTTAIYICDTGYGLSGGERRERRCVRSILGPGEWNGTAPRCDAVSCIRLGSLGNGSITYNINPDVNSFYDFGTIATHTCDQGYFLEGNERRECESDGVSTTWSGTHPVCSEILCTSIPPILNGLVTYSPDMMSPYSYGTTATYSCAPGHGVSGPITRTCGGDGLNATGVWSGPPSSCRTIFCSLLSGISNGVLDLVGTVGGLSVVGTEARYSCNPGYYQEGDRVRTCMGVGLSDDGMWSGMEPSCIAITCNLLDISNGTINYSSDSEVLPFEYQTTATYSCNTRHFLTGNPVRTCGGDGYTVKNDKWNGTKPICLEITCLTELPIANGFFTYNSSSSTAPFASSTTITYSCDTGYGLSGGERSRICVGSTEGPGEWSGTAPNCKVLTCDTLLAIENGTIEYSIHQTPPFEFGAVAIYSCQAGFSLTGGEARRMCDGDDSNPIGYWSGTTPNCSMIRCPALDQLSNGMIDYNTTSENNSNSFDYGTVVTHYCTEGYALIGGIAVRICGGNGSSAMGEWEGTPPICSPIYCASLGQIENGATLYSPDNIEPNYDYGTRAFHSCSTGYYLEGQAEQFCRDNNTGVIGDWGGQYPRCSAILCPALDALENGSIVFSTDETLPFEFGTRANHTCNPPYQLNVTDVFNSSSYVRECEGNYSSSVGRWSGYEPVCIRLDRSDVIYEPCDWLILVYICIVIVLLILVICVFCIAIYTICLRRKKKKKFTPAPPPDPPKKKALIRVITPSVAFVNPANSSEFSLQFEPEQSVAIATLDDEFEEQYESVNFA